MIQQFFAFTKKIIIRLDGWTGCSNDKKFSQNLQQFNLTHLVPVVHGTHHSEGASLVGLFRPAGDELPEDPVVVGDVGLGLVGGDGLGLVVITFTQLSVPGAGNEGGQLVVALRHFQVDVDRG